MSLALTVDYGLKRLAEPGYWQRFASQQLADQANPGDSASARGFWFDPITKTLMLQPLQFRPDWLNTSAQSDSIIRLTDMNANALDLAAGTIYEANIFGNSSNPWIFHSPVTPAALTPINGVADLPNVGNIEPLANGTFSLTAAAPGAAPEAMPGAAADGRFLVGTKNKLEANQALYLRFKYPEQKAGHQTIYAFVFGQLGVVTRFNNIEVFEDTSVAGDRSNWRKLTESPIFSKGPAIYPRFHKTYGSLVPYEAASEDRSLFILPFARNKVLFLANTGRSELLTVRREPQRRADGTDWDIVRSDSFVVWALTPSPGRFQVQKVKWKEGPVKVQLPPVRLDYDPAVLPTTLLDVDTDYGTSITATVSKPPSYTYQPSNLNPCPVPAADSTYDQGATFGVVLTFNSGAAQRRTPFFYTLTLDAQRTLLAPLTSAVTFQDSAAVSSRIQQATITVGDRPGESQMTVALKDFDPFLFAPYYYRSGMVLRLADLTLPSTFTPHFVGLAEPNEVIPLRFDTRVPRDIDIRATDLWRVLTDSFLRNQRDWTGYGHITVVKSVAEQAGIDVSAGEYPSHTDPVDTGYNTALGGVGPASAKAKNYLNPGWQPKLGDTAASYIERIAHFFSGWRVGFRPDGTFFYLPDDWFTRGAYTVAATFYEDSRTRATAVAGGAPTGPTFRDPVQFRTEEPEANVIQVVAGNDTDGDTVYSPVFVDYASILNVNAVNFIGRWKAGIIRLGGTFTCDELRRFARIIWDEARRRRRKASFVADYVQGLKVGQAIRLHGYGDYKLLNYSADFVNARWHPAHYEAQLIEAGY